MAFYEFAGIAWGPRHTDLVPQPSPPQPFVSERHVPYSNITVIDIGGSGPRRLSCSIRVRYDDRLSFEALLMQTQPIIVAGKEWAQATLIKLENHQMTPRPVVGELPDFEAEYHFYDAEWIIAGLPT